MLILGGLFSACSGFLDEDPKSKIPEEEAYKSEKLVYVNTIATIYTSLGIGYMEVRIMCILYKSFLPMLGYCREDKATG